MADSAAEAATVPTVKMQRPDHYEETPALGLFPPLSSFLFNVFEGDPGSIFIKAIIVAFYNNRKENGKWETIGN